MLPRPVENEISGCRLSTENVCRFEGIVDSIEAVPRVIPTHIELHPTVVGECRTHLCRNLRVVETVPFKSPSAIIDGGKAAGIPARHRRRKIERTFCSRDMSAFSKRGERAVLHEGTDRRLARSLLCVNADHAANSIRPIEHTLSPTENFDAIDVVRREIGKIILSGCRTIHDHAINHHQRMARKGPTHLHACRCAWSSAGCRKHPRR